MKNFKSMFTLGLSVCALCFVFVIQLEAQDRRDPKQLTWQNFRPNMQADESMHRLLDGDVIMLTREVRRELAKDEMEIVLKTDLNVTWWKEIKLSTSVWKPDGSFGEPRAVNAISTQDDDHGPKSFRVKLQDFAGRGYLTFSKAKVLGVHTEIYRFGCSVGGVVDCAELGGKRLTFTWQKD